MSTDTAPPSPARPPHGGRTGPDPALRGRLARPAAAAATGHADTTLRPDPAQASDPFQGWGTSLVWFANATGHYPDEIREELTELTFGDEGLGLNIARYNIGGGHAPDVEDYLRPGGPVEGWWQAPEGTVREDTGWWDPGDPDHWDEDADATQRWWVDRVKGDVDHWEAFSNSPPWFMTGNGYVSGGSTPRRTSCAATPSTTSPPTW